MNIFPKLVPVGLKQGMVKKFSLRSYPKETENENSYPSDLFLRGGRQLNEHLFDICCRHFASIVKAYIGGGLVVDT